LVIIWISLVAFWDLRRFQRDILADDFSIRPPNQSMKPTQHFVVSFFMMRSQIAKVLGGLSLSR
jgi:hypothetical protein